MNPPHLHAVPALDDVELIPPTPADEVPEVPVDGVLVEEVVPEEGAPVDPPVDVPVVDGDGVWSPRPRPERMTFALWAELRWLQVADRCWWTGWHVRHVRHHWWHLARWSHKGFGRLVLAWWVWQLDLDGKADRNVVRSEVGKSASSSHLTKAREDHRAAVRGRFVALLIAVTAAPVLVLVFNSVVVALVGWWALPAAWAVVWLPTTAVLGAAGRPADQRALGPGVTAERPMPFRAETITSALALIGVGKIKAATRQDEDAIWFVEPISRAGHGKIRAWRALIDLPRGVTVAEVGAKHEALASALRCDDRRLVLTQPKRTHPGRLQLMVLDDPLAEVPMPRWPLAEHGSFNAFGSFALGIDQAGELVLASIAFVAWLIGAMPRMGKTAAMRLFGLAAALDPRIEVHVLNCKGGADFGPLRPVCHTYISSARASSRPAILADLLQVKLEMERRYDVLEDLADRDPERCPEGKVTDALASDRSLGLHPVVVLVDEAHMAYGDELCGAEISVLTEDLARRGPAVYITTVNASQRMDSASVPRGVSATAARRLCFKTGDVTETDLILGTGANRRGATAHLLAETDTGVAYATGEGMAPVLLRTFYVDLPEARLIVARALEARRAAGRLTGMAAGEDVPDLGADLADALDAAWPTGLNKARYGELAEALAAMFPQRFEGWTAEQVSAGCRALGLPSVQVARGSKANRTNLRGLARADLDAFLQARADAATSPIEDPEDDDGAELATGPWETDDGQVVAD